MTADSTMQETEIERVINATIDTILTLEIARNADPLEDSQRARIVQITKNRLKKSS